MNNPQAFIASRALPLFNNCGIRNSTMDDVARHCGISKKTLYSSFSNKTELLLYGINSRIAAYRETAAEIRQGAANAMAEVVCLLPSIERAFRDMSTLMMEELNRYHFEAATRLQAFLQQEVKAMTLDNIGRGQEEELYHRLLNNDIMADLRQQQLTALHHQAATGYPVHEALWQMTLHYLRGLATSKGMETIEQLSLQYQQQPS